MLDTKLTVKEIILMILQHLHGGRYKIAVPNVSYGLGLRYEADLIVVNPANRATEYEIKRSWEDFLADFLKKKDAHKANCIFYFAYVVPEKIIDKVINYLDKKFKKEEVPCVFSFREDKTIKYAYGKKNKHIKISSWLDNRRKMTTEELSILGHLLSVRYWKLISDVDFKSKEDLFNPNRLLNGRRRYWQNRGKDVPNDVWNYVINRLENLWNKENTEDKKETVKNIIDDFFINGRWMSLNVYKKEEESFEEAADRALGKDKATEVILTHNYGWIIWMND